MPFSLYRVSKSRYYVIHNESGAKHSPKPLTYLDAKAQLRALNALYHNEPLHPLDVKGGSFFDSLKSGIKNVYGRVKGFITGDRLDFNPIIRKLMAVIGDKPITAMVVIREPVKQYVDILSNIITLGEMNKYKSQYNIDNLFHLYAVATLSDGTLIKYEKNEEINIETMKSIPTVNDNFKFVCEMPKQQLTFNIMFNKTISKIGKEKFYKYNALTTNCQKFIYDNLSLNGFNDKGLKDFIIQDLSQLATKLNSTSTSILGGLTNLKKRINILTGGAGFNKLN
jgi:hypothetical protein